MHNRNLNEPFLNPTENHPLIHDYFPLPEETIDLDDDEQYVLPQDHPMLGTQNSKPSILGKIWGVIKKIPLYTVSILNAAAPAINGFANAIKTPLKDLGLQVLKNAKPLQLVHGSVNFISSLSINIMMNLLFLPTAADTLFKEFKTFAKSPKTAIINIFAIILALSAAIASGAIAFESFFFMGLPVAITSSVVTLLVVFASRYIGVQNIFKRLVLLFDKNANAQLEFADHLEHLNTKNEELNNSIRHIIADALLKIKKTKTLNPDDFQMLTKEEQEKCLKNIAKGLDAYAQDHTDLVNEKTPFEKFCTGLSTTFDFTFSAFMGFGGGAVYTQKGFDGLNDIAHLFTKNGIGTLAPLTKFFVGLPAGITNSLTYASNAYEFRATMVKLGLHIKENHSVKEVIKAGGLITANVFSLFGPKNVAEGVVNHDNIIFVHNQPTKDLVVVLGTTGAASGLNMKNSTNQFFFSNPIRTTCDKEHPEDTILKDVIRFSKNTLSNIVSEGKTVTKLIKANGIFKENIQTQKERKRELSKNSQHAEKSELKKLIN